MKSLLLFLLLLGSLNYANAQQTIKHQTEYLQVELEKLLGNISIDNKIEIRKDTPIHAKAIYADVLINREPSRYWEIFNDLKFKDKKNQRYFSRLIYDSIPFKDICDYYCLNSWYPNIQEECLQNKAFNWYFGSCIEFSRILVKKYRKKKVYVVKQIAWLRDYDFKTTKEFVDYERKTKSTSWGLYQSIVLKNLRGDYKFIYHFQAFWDEKKAMKELKRDISDAKESIIDCNINY